MINHLTIGIIITFFLLGLFSSIVKHHTIIFASVLLWSQVNCFCGYHLYSLILFIHFLDIQIKSFFNINLLSYSFTDGEIDYSIEFTGFSENFINNIISMNKGIAISLTSCKNEKDNYVFISSNNKSTIEKMYALSEDKVDKRTMNIGL